MLVEVSPDRYPNMYEIVHTVSTLVMTAQKDYIGIRFGKWKGSQLFFPQRCDIRKGPNQFWFKEGKESNRYLTCDGSKVFMKEMGNANDEACVW